MRQSKERARAGSERRARIAIFAATSGHSGVDRVIRNLAPEIARRGMGVDILRVRNHGPRIEATTAGVRLVDLQAAHAYTALPGLVRYLRNESPDALLSDKDRANRVAILAHRLSRSQTRLVVRTGTTVSHNLAERRPIDRTINLWSMRHLYRGADAIVLPSRDAAEDFSLTVGTPLAELTVCPSPIATPELESQAAEPFDWSILPAGDGPLIVGLGELSVRKDFATALRAFARLKADRSARLVIMGEGRKRSELEKLAGDLGIAERVAFPGFVANPYPLLACCDVFVHSARMEGSPVAVMEAVALGRPVVCTDCPSGPREILDEGQLGTLVPIGDEHAMGYALGRMLDAPPPATKIRAGAAPFSLAASADAYLAVLGVDPPFAER